MSLPVWLLQHTATIEPLEGEGPYGPVYAAPYEVACLADDERRMVRDEEGSEVVSEVTIYMPPATHVPAGSRVTVNGRQTIVISANVRDGGGLPTPDHVEVVCR